MIGALVGGNTGAVVGSVDGTMTGAVVGPGTGAMVGVAVGCGIGVGVNTVNSNVSPPQAAANEAMTIRRIPNASSLAGIVVSITAPRVHPLWKSLQIESKGIVSTTLH